MELVFCLENASLFPLEEIQEVVNFFGEGIEIFEFVGFSICNRTKEFIKES